MANINTTAIWKAFILYTVDFGIITAGGIYILTHSGIYLLGLAGLGLLLTVLGAGASGPVSASGAAQAEDANIDIGANLSPFATSNEALSMRVAILFYGLGLLLWSFIMLFVFLS